MKQDQQPEETLDRDSADSDADQEPEVADPFEPKAADDEDEHEAGKVAAPPPPAAQPRAARPTAGKGWPREVVVLGMVLSGLAGVLVMLNLPGLSPRAAAALGKAQTIEVTLVAGDRDNLACGSATVLDGLRCSSDGEGKRWPDAAKGNSGPSTLQPYTTTDRKSVLAAGVWDDPALEKSKLPKTRFRARCDFAPVGEVAAPKVRWTKGQFKDSAGTWRAGRASNCKILDG